VAETLVASVQEASDCQELGSRGQAERLAEQVERTRVTLDHVRSQNTVLNVTLEQARDQLDRLTLLVGKFESNAVALSMAVENGDAALQVAEALLCLLETELGLVLANCRPKTEDDQKFLRRAADSRRQAERHARELLRSNCGVPLTGDWTPADEGLLRDRLCHLKSERSKIQPTIVELESHTLEHVPIFDDVRKIDLETAVLMQELMSMREEKVEIKARLHLLEKERATQEIRAAAMGAKIQTILHTARHISQSNADENISCLISELENLSSCDLRAADATLAIDLRAANTALVSTLERCKRKYQTRLRRLEAQMAALMDRNAQQVNALRQRVALLEGRGAGADRLEETNI